MPPVKRLKVPDDKIDTRLDHFLSTEFPDKSRSYFSRLIKKEHVLINNIAVKGGHLLKKNDLIEIQFEDSRPNLAPADIPLDIVFEDNHLLVINKPAGLIVHPGKGTEGDTLVNALVNYSDNLSGAGASDRPGIVHRLDKNTSGLILVAKTDKCLRLLQDQFAKKSIKRHYRALVWGNLDNMQGVISTHIGRSRRDPTKMTVVKQGREAITHYTVLHKYHYFTLVELKLETGRTHQIRVHMNYIHHPVVGDPDYSGRETQLRRLPVNLRKRGMHLLSLLPYQFLHAEVIEFIHPEREEKLRFDAPLPDTLEHALEKLPNLFKVDNRF
jgi:23S rRNA pseudouridine1911/1915/1917 synthase